MNVEIWYILMMGFSGILAALGGTEINEKIPGQKWIRRILLPILLGLVLFFIFHVDLWRVIAFTLTSFIAFTLPYGDKSDWWSWKKFKNPPKWVTAIVTPLPILFIGIDLMVVSYPFFFLIMFVVGSKTQWKIFEFMAWAWFAACLVAALQP